MVAVDFSDHSLASLRQGIKLARELKAELLLVNVVNQGQVDLLQRIAQQAPRFSVEHYLSETVKDREASFRNLILTNKCAGLSIATAFFFLGLSFVFVRAKGNRMSRKEIYRPKIIRILARA